jgi:hypothetical protein
MVSIFDVSYTVFKDASDLFQVYYYNHPDGYIAGCGSAQFIYVSKILDAADISDFITNLLPSATSVEKEDDVLASPTLGVRENTQSRFDIQDDVIYVGSAPANTSDGSAEWTIKKFTLVDGLATDKKTTAVGSATWTNRDSETYY